MDLLISHQRGHYGRARREILHVLKHLGDEHPLIERTAVEGIAFVRTALDGRLVVQRCRALFRDGLAFADAVKWVPVDYWCETDLQAIYRLLAERVRERIAPDETWGLKVAKHRWQRYHTDDIVTQLAGAIDRKVDLDHPDKLVRVDVVGAEAAISVLRPDDVFSATAIPQTAPSEG
jgi:tRNA(Ser,Leu) C12 N-acetylase TAN1